MGRTEKPGAGQPEGGAQQAARRGRGPRFAGVLARRGTERGAREELSSEGPKGGQVACQRYRSQGAALQTDLEGHV